MTAPRGWKPLQRAELRPVTEKQIVEGMRVTGASREAVIADYQKESECEYWLNDIYQVSLQRQGTTAWINIRRRDGKPIFRDWRHFQQIKNELVGEECEAMELYPAESRLVDTSNKYHLFACTDPSFRFPVGYTERDVSEVDSPSPGMKQRKF